MFRLKRQHCLSAYHDGLSWMTLLTYRVEMELLPVHLFLYASHHHLITWHATLMTKGPAHQHRRREILQLIFVLVNASIWNLANVLGLRFIPSKAIERFYCRLIWRDCQGRVWRTLSPPACIVIYACKAGAARTHRTNRCVDIRVGSEL